MKLWGKKRNPPREETTGHKTERDAMQTPRHGDKIQSAKSKA